MHISYEFSIKKLNQSLIHLFYFNFSTHFRPLSTRPCNIGPFLFWFFLFFYQRTLPSSPLMFHFFGLSSGERRVGKWLCWLTGTSRHPFRGPSPFLLSVRLFLPFLDRPQRQGGFSKKTKWQLTSSSAPFFGSLEIP